MDSYRVEKRAMQKILLPDENAEIGPVPDNGVRGHAEPEMDLLSNIIKVFNDLFGNDPLGRQRPRASGLSPRQFLHESRRTQPTRTLRRTRTGKTRASNMTRLCYESWWR